MGIANHMHGVFGPHAEGHFLVPLVIDQGDLLHAEDCACGTVAHRNDQRPIFGNQNASGRQSLGFQIWMSSH